MYYRWTDKAEYFIARKSLGHPIGKWKRGRYTEIIKLIPDFHHLKRQGFLEEKEESPTPKQLAQRRMWQYRGRALSIQSQINQLTRELTNEFPSAFKHLGNASVIHLFVTDVNSIDLGLLLQKYYPDLFKLSAPT